MKTGENRERGRRGPSEQRRREGELEGSHRSKTNKNEVTYRRPEFRKTSDGNWGSGVSSRGSVLLETIESREDGPQGRRVNEKGTTPTEGKRKSGIEFTVEGGFRRLQSPY